MNDDIVNLNKVWTYTFENDIKNNDFIVAIQGDKKVNANEKHLS